MDLGRQWLIQELDMERKARKRDAAEREAARAELMGGLEAWQTQMQALMKRVVEVQQSQSGKHWVVTVFLPERLRDRASMDDRDWRLLVSEFITAAVLASLLEK
jgi:hypothetical protein